MKHATGVTREPENRIHMRPLIAVVVIVLCAATSLAQPELGWKIAGAALPVAAVAGFFIWRVLWRRIQAARRPDPESTLHLKD